jgi:hypothetical protein
MKGTPLHPLHLRLLPCLRRSLKKKPPRRHELDGLDDLDDLDDDPNEGCFDMDEWFPKMEVTIEIESSSLSL